MLFLVLFLFLIVIIVLFIINKIIIFYSFYLCACVFVIYIQLCLRKRHMYLLLLRFVHMVDRFTQWIIPSDRVQSVKILKILHFYSREKFIFSFAIFNHFICKQIKSLNIFTFSFKLMPIIIFFPCDLLYFFLCTH